MADETPHPTDDQSGNAGDPADEPPLPEAAIDRAERLTRQLRNAVDGDERAAYRRERDALLGEHGYDARVRKGETGETLVLYPAEWTDEGTIRTDRIDDTGRAVERPLSGPGSGADWDEIDEHNRAIAARVRERHGEVHGETATAFAEFMSNHYAKPIERATPDEREEFRREYFPRNAWPTDEQRERLAESIRLVVEAAEGT